MDRVLCPTRILLFAVVFLGVSLFCMSCSDQGALQPGTPNPYEYSDEEIRDLVYSSYLGPPGFYREELYGGYPYYENTVSIRPWEERPHTRIDLCSNDRDIAFAWSESSAVHGAYYLTLVSERETEKYFEFRRVWLDHPQTILLSRIHKCSYLDRSMVVGSQNVGTPSGSFSQNLSPL